MAEEWSYKIDGVELNDYVNYITEIPDMDSMPEMDVVSVPIDGTWPEFIRMQPQARTLTLNIQVLDGSWEEYSPRISYLKSLISGGPHTLTVQSRGMSTPKSVTVVTQTLLLGEPKSKKLVFILKAHNPNWA